MRVCRLTDAGMRAFEEALDELKAAPERGLPEDLRRDPRLVESTGGPKVEPMAFRTRFAFASYIDDVMSDAVLRPMQRDGGIWAWLTIFYFDQVCPSDSKGRRKLGARARYVPRFDSWRHYYRHLLAGPWMIYAEHRDSPQRALALLAGPLDAPGDVVEQLASRQEIVTCPGVVEAITRLYFNPKTGKLRRGVASRGPGAARRLPTVLRQFDLTWDLFSMGGDEVLRLLPAEFERFGSAEA